MFAQPVFRWVTVRMTLNKKPYIKPLNEGNVIVHLINNYDDILDPHKQTRPLLRPQHFYHLSRGNSRKRQLNMKSRHWPNWQPPEETLLFHIDSDTEEERLAGDTTTY